MPSENKFIKHRWNKDFFRHTKAKRIQHQQISISRNIEGSPLNQKKIIPDGHQYLYERIKSTRNANYAGKCSHFSLFKWLLKDDWLCKAEITDIVGLVTQS